MDWETLPDRRALTTNATTRPSPVTEPAPGLRTLDPITEPALGLQTLDTAAPTPPGSGFKEELSEE